MNATIPTRYEEIPIDSIVKGPVDIRKFYDPELLAQLAESQQELGTLQQVVVRPGAEGRYELIIGSRRVRAARKLKLATVPACIIPEVEDSRAVLMALSENIHRAELSPFEEAAAILQLVERFKLPLGVISKQIGRNPIWVSRRLKLLSIPDEIQRMYSEQRLSLNHIEKLMTLPNREDQLTLARVVTHDDLTTGELRTLIERKFKQKPSILRGKSLRMLSGGRAALHIQGFTKWLKGVPGSRAILSGDFRDLQGSLQELRREADAALKRIEHKG